MKKIILGIIILGILCSGCKSRDFEMDWDELENMTTETEGQTVFVPEAEAQKELSPFVEPLMEMVESGEYTSFYCVDIDHDGQNEVVLMGDSKTTFTYLDYVEGNILQNELSKLNCKIMPQKKTNFYTFSVIIAYFHVTVMHIPASVFHLHFSQIFFSIFFIFQHFIHFFN